MFLRKAEKLQIKEKLQGETRWFKKNDDMFLSEAQKLEIDDEICVRHRIWAIKTLQNLSVKCWSFVKLQQSLSVSYEFLQNFYGKHKNKIHLRVRCKRVYSEGSCLCTFKCLWSYHLDSYLNSANWVQFDLTLAPDDQCDFNLASTPINPPFSFLVYLTLPFFEVIIAFRFLFCFEKSRVQKRETYAYLFWRLISVTVSQVAANWSVLGWPGEK